MEIKEDGKSEIGVAAIGAATVFIIQQLGLTMIDIKPNFIGALIVWFIILSGLVYVAWFFPWRINKYINRWVRSCLVILSVILFLYNPLNALWEKEHQISKPSVKLVDMKSDLPKEKLRIELSLNRSVQTPGGPRMSDSLRVDITNMGDLKWFSKEAIAMCDGKIIDRRDRDSGFASEGEPGWINTEAIPNFCDQKLQSCNGDITVKVITSRNNSFTGKLKIP